MKLKGKEKRNDEYNIKFYEINRERKMDNNQSPML